MASTGFFQREPAVIVAGVVGLLTAAMALISAFGFDLSGPQQTAILAFAGAALVLIFGGGLVTRGSVFAPANVVAAKQDGVVVAGPAALVTTGTPVTVAVAAPADDSFPGD